MPERKMPVRMCIACRGRDGKTQMVRVVKDNNGQVFVDHSGKADGRGAYVCRMEKCVVLAQKKKGFERALRSAVSQDIYDALKEGLE